MAELDPPASTDDPDTDVDVEHIDADPKILAYGLHTKLRFYAYHYNLAKLKCKLISVTWLMASFIGFGYLLSGQESNLPVDLLVVMALLSVFASTGVLLLFFLDVAVYHRLLGAIVAGQIDIENKFPEVGRTLLISGNLLIKGKMDAVIYDALFYISFLITLLVVAGLALTEYAADTSSLDALIVGISCIAGLAIAIGAIVYFARASSSAVLFGKRPHKRRNIVK